MICGHETTLTIGILTTGAALIILLALTLIKALKHYVSDQDERFLILGQSYVYSMLVVAEAMTYILTDCCNDYCVFSIKFFVFVQSFLFCQTKFSGRIMLGVPRKVRSVMYVAVLSCFWAVIFFFASTAQATYFSVTQPIHVFDKLHQIVLFIKRPMNGIHSETQIILCAVVPFIMLAVSALVDSLENKKSGKRIRHGQKKGRGKIELSTLLMFIPAMIFLLITTTAGGTACEASIVGLIVMIILICILTVNECFKTCADYIPTSERLVIKLCKELSTNTNDDLTEIKRRMLISTVESDPIIKAKMSKRVKKAYKLATSAAFTM